ncbi:hypothetical protein H4219_004512 [Mycoemilia scoparia]|uniref:Carbohydrate kinase PfkB domain-containing protein n=1 Tax=Mycoemilia scoparia TaxID=417184 RepID=A0A9W7ZZI5_9FUNG|nr:hypothetical protein H4219_004512 [Mycoemilia scoparia]
MNVDTAREVEAIVTNGGCVPATVAIMDGKIRVGLVDEELEKLGRLKGQVFKTSRRDLAVVLGQNLVGATTVSTTMIAAHLSGIKVFVTGGIGGVHRGAEKTWDVSADLEELGRTPVAVVCAGAKSILDIPKTLEYLETKGVPVVTFGETQDFPAFFSPKSGLKSPWHVNTPDSAANIIKTSLDLGMGNGIVFSVPIPDELAADANMIEIAIQKSVKEAVEKGISGKETTPFLLKRLVQMTAGASLESNIGLVKNNAVVGSKISFSLAALYKESRTHKKQRRFYSSNPKKMNQDPHCHRSSPLMVVGGCNMDIMSRIKNNSPSRKAMTASTSYPGEVTLSVGGVGHNIARTAHLLGAKTLFISAIGDDSNGKIIKDDLENAGIDTTYIQVSPNSRTAVYNAIHNSYGDLSLAVADMDIHDSICEKDVKVQLKESSPSIVAFDGNISARIMESLISGCKELGVPILFEPTSLPKSTKVLQAIKQRFRSVTTDSLDLLLDYTTPNALELEEMASYALKCGLANNHESMNSIYHYAALYPKLKKKDISNAFILSQIFSIVIVKLGKDGVMVLSSQESETKQHLLYYIEPLDVDQLTIINTNGAGDSLVGAILAGLNMLGPDTLSINKLVEVVSKAQYVAIASMQSSLSVSNLISPGFIKY